jgi:hypothetical protein
MAEERDGHKPDEQDLDDPLGIAREPVPPDPNIRASDDEASIRRRRARAGLDGHDERPRPGMGDLNPDSDGASGIDMGYGGEGTDLKR